MASEALLTGAAEAAPVARDTTHLVLVRGGKRPEDLSPIPGDKVVTTTLALLAGNLVAQVGIRLLFHATLPAWMLGALIPVGMVAAFRHVFGPVFARRVLMGRASRRLRGTVEAADAVVGAPTLERPAVLVRTLYWEAGTDGRAVSAIQEDVRGVPFLLRLADGRAARIEPTTIFLLEQPRRLSNLSPRARQALGAPWRGWRRKTVRQTAIYPGDELEVVGRLETEVDQAGVGAPARGVPLVTFVRPLSGQVIWARRIEQEEPEDEQRSAF